MPKTTKGDDRKLLAFSLVLNVALVLVVILLSIAMVYLTVFQAKTTAPANVPSNVTVGTLAGIGTPLNASQLNVVNNAPNSYFEAAGEKLLNQSLTDYVSLAKPPKYKAFTANGKPSVIYIGAISCVYCGENRWAMALALSRFGNFSELFNGYSALGDGDIPTLYWTTDNYNATGAPKYGNFYHSGFINFIDAEYDSEINLSIQVQSPAYFASHAPNATYKSAMEFMNSTGKFGGTPFTFWGTSLMQGADAVVFGNTTPKSTSLPIATWSHAKIISQLSSFNDQFAWGEYAAADVYVAETCAALPANTPVSACALPSIKALEGLMNLTATNQSA